MDLDRLKDYVGEFIDKRDWRKFQTTKELAESASIESGELMELFVWRDGKEMDALLRSEKGKELLENVKNETSDVLFACLAIAEHLNFSLEDAFINKLNELDERYAVNKVKGKVVKFPSKK